MKLELWLLDIAAGTGSGPPEAHLWGIDDRGRRVIVRDPAVESYFYLLPADGVPAEALARQALEKSTRYKKLTGAEAVTRRYFGRPASVVRIAAATAESAALGRLARHLGKLPDVREVLEDDLRFTDQYLLDRSLVPCGWHEIEAEEIPVPAGARAAAAFLARGAPRSVPREMVPDLRLLAFSILASGSAGTPRAAQDPVVLIAACTSDGERQVWEAANGNDRAAIAGFTRFVEEQDPDVIFGFESNRLHWPYLAQRARLHGLRLAVDRIGGEPHPSAYGHRSILGRANVDLFDFAEDLGDVKVKTLDNVAAYLGFPSPVDRVEEANVPGYWADLDKRPLLRKQIERDASVILEIGRQSMLDFAIQLAQLSGMPLDQVGAAAAGFRAEHFLMRAARPLGEIAPKRAERPFATYAGGLVLEPRPGIHERVTVLDFRSMYPNLMIRHNLSPDTYVPPGSAAADGESADGETTTAPEVGHRFRREPPGLYKQVLADLLRAREVIREEMGAAEGPRRRLLDARQKVVKILANAVYGYAGWPGARWYVQPVGEAAAAWGRATIQRTLEIARELGLDILYCDTDSLFAREDESRIAELMTRIRIELGLEIRPEKTYQRLLFTEAKKRYAGLLPGGKVEVVGLEVVRGDWAQAAKDMQERLLGLLLRGRPAEEARDLARAAIAAVRNRQVAYRDLIIWKALTKRLRSYEARAPHVEAARRLFQAGYSLAAGDFVGYVIVKGEGKLFERAVPYQLARLEDVDLEYYATHQLAPAAARVLEVVGIGEDELTG